MAENQAQRANITFKGDQYTINLPSEGQLIALSFVAEGGNPADMIGVVGQVVHRSVGDKLWKQFIKGLALGDYTGEDFTELVIAIMKAVTDKDSDGR